VPLVVEPEVASDVGSVDAVGPLVLDGADEAALDVGAFVDEVGDGLEVAVDDTVGEGLGAAVVTAVDGCVVVGDTVDGALGADWTAVWAAV